MRIHKVGVKLGGFHGFKVVSAMNCCPRNQVLLPGRRSWFTHVNVDQVVMMLISIARGELMVDGDEHV
jgi:hypothetical protein